MNPCSRSRFATVNAETGWAPLLGAGVAGAAAGVGTATKPASVVDMPARAVTNDDAPGHVSGKNRTVSDDTVADHPDGHVSGKNRTVSDDDPGHISGKNRTASDDTSADHADAHVSGKGTDSNDD